MKKTGKESDEEKNSSEEKTVRTVTKSITAAKIKRQGLYSNEDKITVKIKL